MYTFFSPLNYLENLMIKINRLFLIPLLVLLVATGCSNGGTKIESEFPIPADVESINTDDDGAVNFQTSLDLSEAVAFYREEFKTLGYVERTLLTVDSETVFSIVFDGHESGNAIVIQGVDLGDNTNVNIRYEDI
jgi:hypothetical protein